MLAPCRNRCPLEGSLWLGEGLFERASINLSNVVYNKGSFVAMSFILCPSIDYGDVDNTSVLVIYCGLKSMPFKFMAMSVHNDRCNNE